QRFLQLLDLLVDGLFYLHRVLALPGHAADLEVAFILHAVRSGGGVAGNLFLENERLIEPSRTAIKQVGEHDQRGLIDVIVGDAVIADVDLGVGLGVSDHALLGQLLDLAGAHRLRLARAALQAAEVGLGQFGGLRRLEVADEAGGEIVGGVVDAEVALGFLLGYTFKIARPPDHGPTIGRRLPEHALELLLHTDGGGGVRAPAALFVTDVAFGVEVAEHQVGQTVGFHPEPEFELVGGDIDEVDGHVVISAGILAGGAGGAIDAVELVLDRKLARLLDEGVILREQLGVPGGADLGVLGVGNLAAALPFDQGFFLLAQLGAYGIHLAECFQVLVDIGGTDGV